MSSRSMVALCVVAAVAPLAPAQEIVARPDVFPTLVNPMCSHCRDEAKRRAGDLKADDRVLCWIRGYSDGGAIPYRFFLNKYPVISDTYGVFVRDPDAGFARGFAPSLDFTFHGWRNGVMVMKHKDGTLYSCLTGIAFDGPKKGEKLKAVPTLVSDWGPWLERYPQNVAYHMFDKYQPVEAAAKPSADSLKSRGPADKRLSADAAVLGVTAGKEARAYPLSTLAEDRLIHDTIDGEPCVVLWLDSTKTAAAYRPIAVPPPKTKGEPRRVTLANVRFATKPLSNPGKGGFARPLPNAEWLNQICPFQDKETLTFWDIAGRGVDGELKDWTLEWLDGVQVNWFAWAAEYPTTTIYGDKKDAGQKAKDAIKEIAGTAEFLRAVPKKFGLVQDVDVEKRTVTLRINGDKEDTTWPLTADAEIKLRGWWGRLEQLKPKKTHPRVWAWFHVDRSKKPVAIFMLADMLTEQDIHGGHVVKSVTKDVITLTTPTGKDREIPVALTGSIPKDKEIPQDLHPKDRVYVAEFVEKERWVLISSEYFESWRKRQQEYLRNQWILNGLPGTVGYVSVYSGEADILVDHEAMRWARFLKPGDKIELVADPPIKGVVKTVTPLREKTQVRLVVKSFDLADVQTGKRIHLKSTPPETDLYADPLPPDIDRPRKTKEERIEWFLASIYCTCGVGGDGCTGHAYTLASCNPNACGAPNATRKLLAKKIDEGLTDRQIFEQLLKDRGPLMLRSHLLP